MELDKNYVYQGEDAEKIANFLCSNGMVLSDTGSVITYEFQGQTWQYYRTSDRAVCRYIVTEKDFAEAQAELCKDLPKELIGPLQGLAWDEGHSAGYAEVINYLKSYISLLKEPLDRMERRIRKEYGS